MEKREYLCDKQTVEPVEIRLPLSSESGTVWLASLFPFFPFFPFFLRTYHQEIASIPLPDFVVGIRIGSPT